MQPPGPGEVRELVDQCGKKIGLKYEQWRHIAGDPAHRYMDFNFDTIVEAVSSPDFIVASAKTSTRLLYHRAITHKAILDGVVVPFRGYTVVVVDAEHGLVITAYMPDQRKKGRTIWQK